MALQHPARRRGLRLPDLTQPARERASSLALHRNDAAAVGGGRLLLHALPARFNGVPTDGHGPGSGSFRTRSSTPGSASSYVRGQRTSSAASGSTSASPRSRWPRSARRSCSASSRARGIVRDGRDEPRRTRSATSRCSAFVFAVIPSRAGAPAARGCHRRRLRRLRGRRHDLPLQAALGPTTSTGSSTSAGRAPTSSSRSRPGAGDAIDARAVLRGWAMLVLPAGATLAALGLLLATTTRGRTSSPCALASAALLVGVAALHAHVPREPADAAAQRARGDDRRAHRPRRTAARSRRPRARRGHGIPQVLALFDLDGFKAYNDTFGHPAGDVLLARLGSSLGERGRRPRHRLPHGRRRVLRPRRPRGRHRTAVVGAPRPRSASTAGVLVVGCSRGWSCSTCDAATRRARPCASPTSGCTRTSAAGARRARENDPPVSSLQRRRARGTISRDHVTTSPASR